MKKFSMMKKCGKRMGKKQIIDNHRDALTIFCPRCGSPMSEKNGSLICKQTAMELSPLISSHIKNYFIYKSSVPYKAEMNPPNEAIWFCPGCGVKMNVSEGIVKCPKCGQSLNPFIKPLTELYFHLPIKK